MCQTWHGQQKRRKKTHQTIRTIFAEFIIQESFHPIQMWARVFCWWPIWKNSETFLFQLSQLILWPIQYESNYILEQLMRKQYSKQHRFGQNFERWTIGNDSQRLEKGSEEREIRTILQFNTFSQPLSQGLESLSRPFKFQVFVMAGVVSGVHELHKQRIVHGDHDIRSWNIHRKAPRNFSFALRMQLVSVE